MEHRHLGRTGMLVSSLSYGNWLTHGSQIEQDQATACVRAALDAGITTFDTADVYAIGKAEEVLGAALKGVRRDSIEIFTKVYWPTGPNPNNRGLSRKHIMESLDASLLRLGTDHVDLLQAHRFDYATPLDETLRAFDDLVRMGKVHYIGVSEWKASEIEQALVIAKEMGLDRIVSSQPQYSLLWRVIEQEVIPVCETNGISQIVWSPLAQGVLSGKYTPGGSIPEGSRGASKDANMVSRFLREETLTAVASYVALCHEAGLKPSQVALAWVLRNKNVASAILGASRPEQILENVGALDIQLDDDFVEAIETALRPVAKFDPSLTISPPERV